MREKFGGLLSLGLYKMKKVIAIEDKEYPVFLKKINDPPKKLFYKGEWDAKIFENCLAVVGSRRMTTHGKRAAELLAGEVAARGITIVSGFMYGVDATAHRAALNANGRTIAVMPCGIDLIHPEYQEELYNDILENNGLIVSEYEGDFQPTLWTYPRRNRIVAGLSKAVLVIEAGIKSGSLITANWAKKFERKIFAVPGPIFSSVSKGTNQLIKDGASIATESKDILDYYRSNFEFSSSLRKQNFSNRFPLTTPYPDSFHLSGPHDLKNLFSSLENQIIEQLQREPLEIDSLARNLGIPVSQLGTLLSIMQIKGFVSQEGGKYHSK